MKKLLVISVLLSVFTQIYAQRFEDYFIDRTLRIDYTFAGNQTAQNIYVDELVSTPRWFGKRQRLSEVPLKGNGQIIVSCPDSHKVIYRNSFSTLFQEWLTTNEAKHTQKSFENVFLVPFPKQPVDITIELYDYHNRTNAKMTHRVDPKDILIRNTDSIGHTPYRTLLQATDTNRCIHIAFVAEGYQAHEMDTYLNDCRIAIESLFQHEPFKHLKGRFNIIAVESPSIDSGTSEPNKGIWKNTVLGSHFDTFYSNRYLTTLHLKKLHDVLSGTPYEHIIVLVNTERYGGGGIYNSYNLTYTHGRYFRPVVVHEFGHSFGGLGDEYPYGDDDPMYFADTEPWEPNLTTKHDFKGKWENLIREGKAGFVEGGGYLTKGVWRGFENCRMRTNEEPEFCLVCQQAIQNLIDFYTK
ncbi:M64 family metallopeptidase [Prevotella sp. P6B1]|uniref:M64 family metallopeptidase n=1 Tax=Prevotella sp. P6B1 TaxID=1410613 RepID=UPI00051C084F|nr:M64 family metallopeptidase [Prevotella sp. P6B1]